MPFQWQHLQRMSGSTAHWIMLSPTAVKRETSIIVMSSSYVSCPRQSGPLLPSQPEAVWTNGISSWTTAKRTTSKDPVPFSPKCIMKYQSRVTCCSLVKSTIWDPPTCPSEVCYTPPDLSIRDIKVTAGAIGLNMENQLWMKHCQVLKKSQRPHPDRNSRLAQETKLCP